LVLPASIPSVDHLLGTPAVIEQTDRYGRSLVLELIRLLLTETRSDKHGHLHPQAKFEDAAFGAQLRARIGMVVATSQRPVLNLTGTVIHANLGRAVLPDAAVQEQVAAARNPTNLEYDLGRGERDEGDSGRKGRTDAPVGGLSNWPVRFSRFPYR